MISSTNTGKPAAWNRDGAATDYAEVLQLPVCGSSIEKDVCAPSNIQPGAAFVKFAAWDL